MSIARDLVTLDEELRKANLDPFAPSGRSNSCDSALGTEVLNQIEVLGFQDPMRVMHLCLQALRVQYEEHKPRFVSAELVATLPPGVPGVVRSTGQVLREMLRPPIQEIILLGYELTDKAIIRLLEEAAQNGTDVIIICDRQRGWAKRLIQDWPAEAVPPRLFVDSEQKGRAPYSSMHAKCLLVDGGDLLITSANFTFHGLEGNIEIGVRLSGAITAEARKIFSYLVESGIVVEASF